MIFAFTFKKEKGLALVTVILIAFILLVLGIALLSFTLNDSRRTGHVKWSEQAFYSARAGLAYARESTTPIPAGGTVDIHIEGSKYFSVKVESGYYVSTGKTQKSDNDPYPLAKRIIKVKVGDISSWEDKWTEGAP